MSKRIWRFIICFAFLNMGCAIGQIVLHLFLSVGVIDLSISLLGTWGIGIPLILWIDRKKGKSA